MIPSIEHIIKKRHHNRRRLRFMAMIFAVIGMIIASWAVLSSLLVDHTWAPSMPLLVFACGFAVPVLPLWLLDKRIAVALVPMPNMECPGCGYNIAGLNRPICPECGLSLPAAWAMPGPNPQVTAGK
ncbi:MAG TPA: hypothetical protein VFE47_31640 [Tepidisphaeraceae bacterium]|jgi:MFS family permease|nr:hypothetical protein [Tepidisphaeraceae bacterium]